MKIVNSLVLATALCALHVSSAFAATVSGSKIKVNSGAGFVAVSGATVVKPGDLVMADGGGRGLIRYDDNCVEEVLPGAVVAVKPFVTCSQTGSTTGSTTGLTPGATTAAIAGGALAVGGLIYFATRPSSP